MPLSHCSPPVLALSKTCPIPNNSHFQVGEQITITLELNNTGGNANHVIILDKINIPAGVVINNFITNPVATVTPMQTMYENTDILVTWRAFNIAAGSTVQLTVTFTILDAPTGGSVITNVDAGICQLNYTGNFTCTIPVIKYLPPPLRGLSFQNFAMLKKQGKVNLY